MVYLSNVEWCIRLLAMMCFYHILNAASIAYNHHTDISSKTYIIDTVGRNVSISKYRRDKASDVYEYEYEYEYEL